MFGYDFFDKVPTTVTALSDLPIPNDYVLSANDQLRITSVGSESFTYTVQVGLDGSILIPNIGITNSYGKKLSEVRESIKAIISQAYPGSIADISLINLSAKKISIIGAVSNPGTYLVNPFTTISNAIAYAGGVQNYGSLRSINYMSASGKSLEFDLYDFLVKGDRSNDLVVNSGDTILVNGTDNFIRISGEVIRPMIYEYKSTDTFRDILSFALGPKSSANVKNISISANQDGSNVTIFPDLNKTVADMAVTSMYLGRKSTQKNNSIFVGGEAISSGYYNAKTISELLEQLSFDDDIYPFYVQIKQTYNNGAFIEYNDFSLSDKSTFQNEKLKDNTEITFYSREQFTNLDNPQPSIQRAGNNSIVVSIDKSLYILPVVGKFKPSEIYNYLGIGGKIDDSGTVVITNDNVLVDVNDKIFDADDVRSINFVNDVAPFITVEILGEVTTPGQYTLPVGSTIADLYKLAGGVRSNASVASILIRESVKEKENQSILEAQKFLKEVVLQNMTQQQLGSPQNSLQAQNIDDLIKLTEVIEPVGRVTGDYGYGTAGANTVVLENNDQLFVPLRPSTISIFGQVNSPLTVSFNDQLSYNDYIDLAGGLTDGANLRKAYVIKANGVSMSLNSSLFERERFYPEPGDSIIIPRKYINTSPLDIVNVTTTILSDLAFTAASLNAIQK